MLYTPKTFEAQVDGKTISIETGRLAKQASGAVLVSCGGTAVLVTVVAASKPKDLDFLPLTVNYQEQAYAAGKIPGGFFKREGRPGEKETLTCRLIDRPLRPLLPKSWRFETQIIALVVSADQDNDPDMLAMIGASAALTISDIPFAGPIAGIRVGRVDGKWVAYPTYDQLGESDANILLAASKESLVMVEGGAQFLPEADIVEALAFGHKAMQPIIELQERMRAEVGKEKRPVVVKELNQEILAKVTAHAEEGLRAAFQTPNKAERGDRLSAIKEDVMAKFAGADEAPEVAADVSAAFSDLKKRVMRRLTKDGKRLDGRKLDQVREIMCEVGVLPRAHGSALFTRGETQALVVITLGTSQDAQWMDSLKGDYQRKFLLHYNFPPFSVGEAGRFGFTGRREVGHGALAWRAVDAVLMQDELPYTIRIVSEILESNGSSSMATVCGASLGLLDAGIAIKAPVAGIAMGLIKEDNEFIILSDILGDEDHLGDMDFKVCGTEKGITSLQMDIKVTGITNEILTKALDQAKAGRLHILGEMAKALSQPRPELSPFAPRLTTLKINPDKIRDVIGSGGKTIRGIVAETGAKIDVEDDGTVTIFSADAEGMARAVKIIKGLTEDALVGAIYLGKVRKIMDFGAFVEILPGTDGLVHISQLANERVQSVNEVLNEGDEVLVKVLGIDAQGKIKLSRKDALDATVEQAVNR
jgi:polyribonucleotide nucleotidyltransferase